MKFRLYKVTVHANFTRTFVVPSYEIPVIKAAWRGVKIETEPLHDTREVNVPASEEWARMARDFGKAIEMVHPGPERLEQDMERDAESTATWLEAEAAKAQRQAEDAQDTEPEDEDGGEGGEQAPATAASVASKPVATPKKRGRPAATKPATVPAAE